MAELIWRLRTVGAGPTASGRGDRSWFAPVAAAGALVVAGLVPVSPQAACGVVLVVLVVAIHQRDRQLGIIAVFALWFSAPFLRRVFLLMTGHVSSDPLSVAPFVATAVIAVMELMRVEIPTRIRRILLLAGAGFALGLPLGILHPQAGLYAFVAYLAGISGAVLGFTEGTTLDASTLRRVLLFVLLPVAIYAIVAQRLLSALPSWDHAWVNSVDFTSLGADSNNVRLFGTLNSPGALAALLGLSLLCYLSLARARLVVVAGAGVILVALSLTYVRSAWVGLLAGALAHVIATRGRSARVVFGAVAVIFVIALVLSPVSASAHSVIDRFKSIATLNLDTSANQRQATFSETFPVAVAAPLGHGLGSAGEPSKLNQTSSELRFPDNGYLALMYQVGPAGWLLVIAAVGFIVRAAWNGARARAPGQDLRALLFAMLVYMLVLLTSGDQFYGSLGVIFWFIGGQALAFDYRQRADAEAGREARISRAAPATA